MTESFVNVTEGSGKKLHSWNRTIGANSVEDEYTVLGEYPHPTYVAIGAAVSAATAASHILQLMAGASLNVYIRRVWVTQHTVATAAALSRFQLVRLTTAGTGGTATTPSPYDTTDSASGATAMTLPTAKGTEGVVVHHVSWTTTQTVSTAGGVNGIPLIDFTGHHAKSLRISAGTGNGIAFKNVDALAGLQLNVLFEFVELNY